MSLRELTIIDTELQSNLFEVLSVKSEMKFLERVKIVNVNVDNQPISMKHLIQLIFGAKENALAEKLPLNSVNIEA